MNHINISVINLAILGFAEGDIVLFNQVIKLAKRKNIRLIPIPINKALNADILLINCPELHKYNINDETLDKLNQIPIISFDKEKLQKYKISSKKVISRPIAWSDLLYDIVDVHVRHKLHGFDLILNELEDNFVFDGEDPTIEAKAIDQCQYETPTVSEHQLNGTTPSNSSIDNLDNDAIEEILPDLTPTKPIEQNNDITVSKMNTAAIDAIQPIPDSGKPKILLVDDSHSIRNIVSKFLIINGYEVQTASSATEGIQYALHENYDCVLLDVIMPDQNGYEVCREIKKHRRNLPVILLTTKSTAYDQIKGRMAGCDEYLTKPTTPTKLFQTLNKFVPIQEEGAA